MNEIFEWMETDLGSDWRLANCDLRYLDCSYYGEPMTRFMAKGAYLRCGDAAMVSIKVDTPGSGAMRWTPDKGPIEPGWTGYVVRQPTATYDEVMGEFHD